MSGTFQARVAHFPDAPFSSGPDFCELAESVGVNPFPWQRWVLDKGLQETHEGRWASFQNTIVVSRQNGKDEIFLILGLGWLFITGERLIGHSAHEYKTAMEAFRRLTGVIENSDDLRRKVKKIINTNGEEGIELHPGATIITGSSSLHTTIAHQQRMRFLARSKGAGRGFSFDKMIWNEAYALTAPQVDAVLPTMSARPNPQLWLGSSPPLDETLGEAMFRARRNMGPRSMFIDFGMPFTLDEIGPCATPGCSHQYGKVAGCILDDPEVWGRVNPSYPRLITREAIERERESMDPVGFARERLGAWPPDLEQGYQVITQKQWDDLADSDSGVGNEDLAKRLVGQPVLAVSVSPRNRGRVNTSISLAQERADDVRHLELVVTGPGTVWVPSTIETFRRTNLPADATLTVVMDPGSPAGSLIPDVEKIAGVDVVKMGTRDVAAAFGMIYDAATSTNQDERTVAHLGQPEPNQAVRVATTRQVGDGHTWDTRNPRADITTIDSMTKALWGLASQTGDAPVEPWVMFA